MRLRQEITTRRTKSSPTAGNNKGASRLTTGKKLAYGEQNIRPLAELTPVYGEKNEPRLQRASTQLRLTVILQVT